MKHTMNIVKSAANYSAWEKSKDGRVKQYFYALLDGGMVLEEDDVSYSHIFIHNVNIHV